MAQYIKPEISGLNTGHALYADIQAFLEFGQLDKELVGDTALTTTAALVDDVDIGDARTFDATADAISETVSITGDVTILVISRLLTGRADGLNGNILFAYAEASGNNVTLQYEGFSPYKYISKSRANYSSTVITNGDGFATDDAFDDGHAVAFTFDINGTNKSAMDGTLGAASSTAPAAAYAGSPVLAFMSSIGSSASVNVGAIVIFNKALSDAELQSVTSDPWALTAAANADPVLDTPQANVSFQVGSAGTIDCGANFSDANVGDTLTFTDDNNLNAVTGLSWNGTTGVYTYDGTLAIGVYNASVTASDGNGGTYPTDTFTITVTALVLTADSITAAPIYAGTTVTVSLSNATNAAGKTLSIPQGALTATAQDINSISFLAPDLKTFGTKTGDYSSNITVTVTDGAESDTIDFQILPDVGDEVGAITAVEGIYTDAAFTGVVATDLYYTTTIADADFTVGAVPVLVTEQVFSLWIQDQTDGVWGSVFTITIPASGVVSGDIPPASRISVFHIAAALRALETYTHNQTNELVLEWLESEGVSRSNLNAMLYGYLGGLGYTGTMNERLYRWSN